MNLHRLREMHAQGEKITMLTAYDATFARLVDDAGVDCILVGDSLGMIVQGHTSTVPVSLDEMVYHTRCVARGNQTAWIVSDLPFGSYQESREQALRSCVALMQAGAHMIKLEGGGWTTEVVHFLTERGIPVCGHLGLTPQSVHALGGYRIQGRDEAGATTLRTRPPSSASCAGKTRPVMVHSSAWLMPTTRGRNQLEQASGVMPRRAKTKPKRASLDAMRISMGSSMVAPTPTAGPLMAAITGFIDSKMRSDTRPPPSRTDSWL